MWQLSEAIDGLADGCRGFGLPVIGGNVSLYNETAGTDIDPTPVVGVLGLADRLDSRPPGPGLVAGDRVLLAGPAPAGGLAGSAWAWRHGERGGALPALDTAAHTAIAALVRGLVADGAVSGVHDVAVGGPAVALAEMAVAGGVGARIARPAGELFGEAPSRVLLSVAEAAVADVRARAGGLGVEVVDLGAAGGDRLVVEGAFDLGLDEMTSAWRDRLPDALGAGVAQA
jgi:phosphoribosylformylglycinamidine synthase